jgi:asparagine synthase (glutamine-hydrolysing)
MCGIFGWETTFHIPEETIDNFHELLKHRGPDSFGFMQVSNEIGFGMTRLAINDLTPSGHQPMLDSKSGVCLVFNGEIYNFKELRLRLKKLNHNFLGTSDSEVVLKLFLEQGLEFVKELDGMFAIAIWDPRSKSTYLIRDRFGQKPLYYLKTEKVFAFCSSAKALANGFEEKVPINGKFVANYLGHGYVNDGSTPFQNVHALPPASIGTLKDGKFNVNGYWDYSKSFLPKSLASYSDAVADLDKLLDATIARLIDASDVRVGVLLSSGIDSSIIASKALKHRPDTLLFTLGFDDPDFDESEIVRERFDKFSSQLKIVELKFDMKELVKTIIELDTPLADTSTIPLHTITKEAQKYVKTCLTGDGADEILGGYSTYHATSITYKLQQNKIGKWILQATNQYAKRTPVKFGNVSLSYKLINFSKWNNQNPLVAHQNWRRIFDDREIQLLTGEFPIVSENTLLTNKKSDHEISIFESALIHDADTWLQNDILSKSDQASMANSLELRAPYLDEPIVKFVSALPQSYKYKIFEGKKILKEIYRREIGPRRKYSRKKGFGSPVSRWIFNNPADFKKPVIDSQLFSEVVVAKLFADHLSKTRDNGQKIFTLFVYSCWISQFK